MTEECEGDFSSETSVAMSLMTRGGSKDCKQLEHSMEYKPKPTKLSTARNVGRSALTSSEESLPVEMILDNGIYAAGRDTLTHDSDRTKALLVAAA